ncbi:MAG: FAD-dependent oxidoreductase, partial [Hyphomonadaceae bacterium]|nr:FAD-dependent oxidoreductase [Hyphomonadaceae bacterium]
HAAGGRAKYGVTLAPAKVDWNGVKAYVRKTIETIAPVDSQERFEGLGCTVIREAARFEDPQTVVSDNVRVKARRIIVATGSRAFIPPIPGLAERPFLTNETIFSLPEFPQHLIVLGGGPIGLELAQAFVRLGAQVTVLEMGRALAKADAAHAQLATGALRSEGVTIRTRRAAQVVSPFDGAIEFAGPFRSYGRVLIINVGSGFRVVLAGLSTTFAEAGQEVLAGEPIGEMANDPRIVPELYMEVRQASEPVDPRLWLKRPEGT